MGVRTENGTVKTDRFSMSYVSFGSGEKTLVALPGLSDGFMTVKGKARLLAGPYKKHLDEYTVYMFSRREDLPEGFTIRDMAGDQAEAMRALGIRRACVLGVSQGGMIAQLLAAGYPDLVSGLVLAVTAPYANGTVKDAVGSWTAMAENGDHKCLMVDTAEKSYSEDRLRSYRKLYPVIGRISRPKSYDRFLINARAILEYDGRPYLDRIACPVLIIGGSEDRITGREASCELHSLIPHSSLFMYEGLGHGLYEEADDFYDRVFSFAEKCIESP
ncbi:MAG: alpha/beta hydrolase [Firmicutes bacterium]|nr:alpha/beta hydrolase [Bacillota bacterium]